MSEVVVVIGPGSIGQAIARRVGAGRHVQVTDTLHAYQLAKRGNALRVMAEAVRWARRGARAPGHLHHSR